VIEIIVITLSFTRHHCDTVQAGSARQTPPQKFPANCCRALSTSASPFKRRSARSPRPRQKIRAGQSAALYNSPPLAALPSRLASQFSEGRCSSSHVYGYGYPARHGAAGSGSPPLPVSTKSRGSSSRNFKIPLPLALPHPTSSPAPFLVPSRVKRSSLRWRDRPGCLAAGRLTVVHRLVKVFALAMWS
jgi:hypothetical protein